MKIELLYFDSCPSWQVGLGRRVELVQVLDDKDVNEKKFLGSPSFRINGVELWDEQRNVYSLSCRVYATPKGMRGSPTVSMLQGEICRMINE
jgi:hypothetical protein